MVRASAKNHGSIAVVVDPARYGEVLDAVRAGGFDLAARQQLALAAFRHTAAYDIAVASWLGSVVAPDDEVAGLSSGFPGWVAASWERAAVLRYGENPHQRAALYINHSGAERAGAGRAAVRQGDELQQLRRRRRGAPRGLRLRRAVRGDHQARQPVRHRGRRRHRRGAPQGARLRPGERVRRRGRGEPAGQRRDGRADRRHLHRGGRRAGVRRGRRSRSWARRRTCGCWSPPPVAAGPGIEMRPISRRRCCCRRPTASTRPATTRPTWTLVAGEPADAATLADLAFAWRAVRAVKSNAILLAARRCDGRRRHGPGQPGRLVPARGGACRGARAGVGRRVGRVLPVRRRAAGADRRPACARSSSRAARCATPR